MKRLPVNQVFFAGIKYNPVALVVFTQSLPTDV